MTPTRIRRPLFAFTALLVFASFSGVPGLDAQTLPIGEIAQNFQLVGHEPLMNRGMNAALAIHGNYAYVGSRTDGKPWNTDLNLNHAGIMVVDISNPADPHVVREIGPPDQALTDQTSREMRVWPQQDLLIVQNLASNCSGLIHVCYPPGEVGGPPDLFTFYDISGANAADPKKVLTFDPPQNPHEFFLWVDPFNEDRALFFVGPGGSGRLQVYDISPVVNRQQPVQIANVASGIPAGALHSLSVSPDGMRAYYAHLAGGFVVANTSAVANGAPSPTVPLVTPSSKRVSWPGVGAHSAVKVWGQDYALVTDEVYGEALKALGAHGCPWGWMRMVDIADPTTPRVAAEYKLPQNEASFCQTDVPRPFSSISAHNPTLTEDIAFISWHAGGLQAVDLDDPEAPSSAGMYSPAPLAAVINEDPALSAGQDKVVMWSYPIIRDGLIYVTDVRNGLYILRYTGEDAAGVAAVDFLEGNSNLGDALLFEPPDPCERNPVPPGYEEECAVTP